MKPKYADLFLIVVAIVWGTGFLFTQLALDNGITPLYIMAIRFSVAAVLLSLIFFKKLKDVSIYDLKSGSILGFVLFLGFITQTVGLSYTTPSKNAFLTSVNVIIVPFLYWAINKKKPEPHIFTAISMSIVGIYLLSINENFRLAYGDFLTILCAVCFAFHIVLNGFYSKKSDPIILTILQMSSAAVFSVIFAFKFETTPEITNTFGILSTVYLGIFSTMIAFLLQTIAQTHTTSTKTAIILSTESLFGTIFSVMFLSEHLTSRMLVGCLIIFSSVIVAETKLEFLNFKKLKQLSFKKTS